MLLFYIIILCARRLFFMAGVFLLGMVREGFATTPNKKRPPRNEVVASRLMIRI